MDCWAHPELEIGGKGSFRSLSYIALDLETWKFPIPSTSLIAMNNWVTAWIQRHIPGGYPCGHSLGGK